MEGVEDWGLEAGGCAVRGDLLMGASRSKH